MVRDPKVFRVQITASKKNQLRFHEDFDPIVINVDRSRHFIVDFWHVKIEAMKDFQAALSCRQPLNFLVFLLCYIHCKAQQGRTGGRKGKSCFHRKISLYAPCSTLFGVAGCRLERTLAVFRGEGVRIAVFCRLEGAIIRIC